MTTTCQGTEPAQAVESLARGLLPGLSSRFEADIVFRQRVRQYAVGTLGWTFIGSGDDLGRLARLAAITVMADIGYYHALRRHHITLPELPQGKSAVELRARLESGLAAAGALIGQAHETVDLIYDIAFDKSAGDTLWLAQDSAVRCDLAEAAEDRIGPLWEALAPTAERRQAGQFYSPSDPIDLILAFCLRSPQDQVLDPACGSGAFLVRALDRLRAMAPGMPAAEMAGKLHGIDRDRGALRLATYNVAGRCGTAPKLRETDFFSIERSALPRVAAVVGNPPYTRQEMLDDHHAGAKELARHAIADDWGTALSGRAGLHVAFLLHAAAALPEGGRLGMLTSNSWLNADYGRAVRQFLLEHCRIIAVIAPTGERWFGAAVNAVALIAERVADGEARRAHEARFVQLKRPLAELIGADCEAPERWRAVERLTRRIEGIASDEEDAEMQVRVVEQGELGLERQGQQRGGGRSRTGEGRDRRSQKAGDRADSAALRAVVSTLRVHVEADSADGAAAVGRAGKWASYLGARGAYERMLNDARQYLRPLGDLASVWRGLTTGCNAFFYVRDAGGGWEGDELARMKRDRPDELRIVTAGDGSRHEVEARFLRPVITSPRELAGLVADPSCLGYQVVLLPVDRTILAGTKALSYVEWGESAGQLRAASRVTCSVRGSWWSLGEPATGTLLWCKTHYTRHLAPRNPGGLVADCNLYHIAPKQGIDEVLLAAVLNSTLVALLKELHGRANLGEGALKTELSDMLALPVPDPRRLGDQERVRGAYLALERRPVRDLIDELGEGDRQELDEALLAAMGEDDTAQCRERREQLYAAVVEQVGQRMAGRATKGRAAVGGPSAAALAEAARAELRQSGAGDENDEERAARRRGVLASFTRDRKLIAAAERLLMDEIR